MTYIGGGWYMEKSARVPPPLRRTKLSKKSQDKEDKSNKKLYEANRWWSYCKFQLHWNKLEWVNPRRQTKRNKHFSVSSIFKLK